MAKDSEWQDVVPPKPAAGADGWQDVTPAAAAPVKESPWQQFIRGIKSVNVDNLPRKSVMGSFLAGTAGETTKSLGAITELAGEATGSKGVQEFGRNVADVGKAATEKAQEVSTPGAIAGQVHSYINPVKRVQQGMQLLTKGAPKTLPGKVAEASTLGAGTTFLTTPGEAGDRVDEAITSGGISAAFPVAGKLLGAVGNKILTASPEAKYLYEKGITPTIGQSLPWLKTAEDKLASWPIIGPQIQKARLRGVEDLNKTVFADVLDPLKTLTKEATPSTSTAVSTSVKPSTVSSFIGKPGQVADEAFTVKTPEVTGREGFRQVKEQVNKAYDHVLKNVGFQADDAFNQKITQLEGMADSLPYDLSKIFRHDIQEVVRKRLGPKGTMDGQAYKQVEEEIGQLAKKYSSSSNATDSRLGPAYHEVHQALKEALRRQNPQYGPQLDAVNESFTRYARLRGAASMAGTEHVFTPSQLSSAVRRQDKSAGRGKYASGEAPMQELADKANLVLPATIPNPSGTAAHLMSLGGLGAGSVGFGGVGALSTLAPYVATYGALALPYIKPIQDKIIKRLMADPATRNLPPEEIAKLARNIAITTMGVQGAAEENPRVQLEKAGGGYVGPLSNMGNLSAMDMGPLSMLRRATGGDVDPASLVGNVSEDSPPLMEMMRKYGRQLGQNILEGHEKNQALQKQAFQDPTRPFKVTNPQALSELGERTLEGVSGFAPAGVFIGKTSPLWNKMMQKEAEKLEKAGVNPAEIWQKTGTGRGTGNAWRQEIDDSGMQMLKNPPDRWNNLEDVMTHPELMKAYPGLKESTIWYQSNLPKDVAGKAVGMKGSPEKSVFILNKLDSPLSKKKTMVHELQHHIQRQEGFPQGGNPEMAAPLAKKQYGKNATEDQIDDVYRRLGGEAEANAVLNRQALTKDQRRQHFPFEKGKYGYNYHPNELITSGYPGGLPLK